MGHTLRETMHKGIGKGKESRNLNVVDMLPVEEQI
jgi:hypothetical protein